MDPSWITAVVLIVINVVGWGYTKVYGFGKLNGRVEKLEKTAERHEKVLNNGVVHELSEVKEQVAKLEGTIQTYIDLTKDRK